MIDFKCIITLLAEEIGLTDKCPSIFDHKAAEEIKDLLHKKKSELEKMECLDFDPETTTRTADNDIPMDSENENDDEEYKPPDKKMQIARDYDDDYVEAAYREWTFQSTDLNAPLNIVKGCRKRKFSTVQKNHRKIKSIGTLYKFEDKQIRGNRSETMKKINQKVFDYFVQARHSFARIHDRNVRAWGLRTKAEIDTENKLKFRASLGWLNKWKRRFGVTSRKITHTVSKRKLINNEKIQDEAITFALEINDLITELNLKPQQIVNTDQSRFCKEDHSGRTLDFKGAKHVFGAAGSMTATSHSYMIMPIVSMDGDLLSPMYLLSAEPGGKFPQNKNSDPSNLQCYPGKSVNMSKNDLEQFMRDVFWPSIIRQIGDEHTVLLLVDSWSSNHDEELIESTRPVHINLIRKLIPAGCTGLIQPLDVGFFRMYKNFVRHITDTICLLSDFPIWSRENFIRLQSLTHYQFSAPRFREMIKYSFFKCRYTNVEPKKFLTPIAFCFDPEAIVNCHICSAVACFRCAHCTNFFCLNHTLIESVHNKCE